MSSLNRGIGIDSGLSDPKESAKKCFFWWLIHRSVCFVGSCSELSLGLCAVYTFNCSGSSRQSACEE